MTGPEACRTAYLHTMGIFPPGIIRSKREADHSRIFTFGVNRKTIPQTYSLPGDRAYVRFRQLDCLALLTQMGLIRCLEIW